MVHSNARLNSNYPDVNDTSVYITYINMDMESSLNSASQISLIICCVM